MQVREITLGRALDEAAAANPEAIGWIFDDERITFAEMRERSDRVAGALLAMGLGKGDIIALWMPNLPEFAYLQFAAARIGVIAAAINTRSKSTEVAHILRQGDIKALFMVETFLKHDFVATLKEVAACEWTDGRIQSPHYPCLTQVVSVGAVEAGCNQSWNGFIEGCDRIAPEALAAAAARVELSDPVLLQYTSGTTSEPKGALLAHVYILNYGVEFVRRMGVRAGETYMNTQPFYHVGGSCAALPVPLSTGVIMVSASYYTAEHILELMERERCVGRSGYSAMYMMEMDHPDFSRRDLSALRAGWCVGSVPILEKIKREFGLDELFQIYAATEGGGTSGYSGESWDFQARSCGTPLTGTELRIVDRETRQPVGNGQVGEIQMRGWLMMNGYYKLPEITAATIGPDGWLNSGDLGWMDETGHLYFAGRAKDMLKVGGENVSAEEVETVLLAHPGIRQVSVIGAPDERLGEVVMAVVETSRPLTQDEIIDYCKPRLANFRVPRYVRFTTDWPMTALGKIQKNVLRQRYCDRP